MSDHIDRAAAIILKSTWMDDGLRINPERTAQRLVDDDLLVTPEMRAVLDVSAQLTGKTPWKLDEYGRNISVGLVALGRAVDACLASRPS